MKSLSSICKYMNVEHSAFDADIVDLYIDAREVTSNSIFIALQGDKNHGLDYIEQVKKRGGGVILSDKQFFGEQENVQIIYLADLASKLASLATWFYDYPSKSMKLVGITGTNGKTSVAHYSAQLSQKCFKTAILGTLGNGVVGELEKTSNTTLHTVSLNRKLAEFRDKQVNLVLMEVSSHAISLGRIAGLEFTTLALTQVTSDHLDFHGSVANYKLAKQQLFTDYQAKNWVVNLDDCLGRKLNNMQTVQAVISYGIMAKAILSATNVQYLETGISADINDTPVKLKLFGQFNLENVLCSIGICYSLGITEEQLISQLKNLRPVSGRMETVATKPAVIIDYAHSEDALDSILKAIRLHLVNPTQKLWLVFGCGGDRDVTKRPLMGKVATKYADHIIVTDDNPRYENPQKIMDDIMAGITSDFKQISCIHNRSEAIKTAIQQAKATDVVVIAGKGHEDYQDIKGIKYPMSDFAMVSSL